VCLWSRFTIRARREGERPEEDLQVGVGEPEGVPVEQRAQGLDARHAHVGVESMPEGFGVDEVEPVRLVHSPLEPHDPQFGGEVDEGLDRMGHRDAEADDDGFGIEGGASADIDPLAGDLALPADRDVDPPRLLEADAPRCGD
jgi:hypothetical protein